MMMMMQTSPKSVLSQNRAKNYCHAIRQTTTSGLKIFSSAKANPASVVVVATDAAGGSDGRKKNVMFALMSCCMASA